MPAHRRRPLARSRALAPVLALALALAGCSSGSSSSSSSNASRTPAGSGFDGAALPSGIVAPELSLRDEMGARVSLAAFRGHVVLVAFLYSTCGAACEAVAQQIRGALDELPARVPVLVVSANPRADTPATVAAFLQRVSLSGRVRWLTGPPAVLRHIYRAYKVPRAGGRPAAFASATPVVLIDGAGHERVLFQLEQLTPEALSHDLRKLLGRAGAAPRG